jgi:hypothetical protein
MSSNLLCLTVAPAFLSASIYLCLGRLVSVYGEEISRLKPRSYTLIFVFCDIVSIVLQVSGGAIAGNAGDNYKDESAHRQRMKGVHIMLAGLAYQVFSLALFMILWGEFTLRASRAPSEKRAACFEKLRSSSKFKAFQAGKSKNLSLCFLPLLLSLKAGRKWWTTFQIFDSCVQHFGLRLYASSSDVSFE